MAIDGDCIFKKAEVNYLIYKQRASIDMLALCVSAGAIKRRLKLSFQMRVIPRGLLSYLPLGMYARRTGEGLPMAVLSS